MKGGINMTIALCGSSGFIGHYLQVYFTQKNFHITLVNRDDFNSKPILSHKIKQADVIINLVGANVIGRWSKKYKTELYNSRIDNTKKIVDAINECDYEDKLFLSTSAIGIYSDDVLNDEENYTYGDTFLTHICKNWEQEALKAKCRVIVSRFGVVLGDGGALDKMLGAFKLGLGGKIADGSQAFSYVHIHDLARAYAFYIENKNLDGVFNLCTPNAITNNKLTSVLSKILNRPAFLPLPAFVLKMMFGEGACILTHGQNVYPKRLLESGFKFEYETIEAVLSDLLRG